MRAVNLLPPEQRGDASLGGGRSGGGAYVVLGLLAGLTVLGLLYGIARHNVSSRRSELDSINAKIAQTNASAGQLSQYTSFIEASSQRTKTISELASSRFAWASTLHELGRVLPAGVSISSLEGNVATATATGGSSPSASSSSSSSSSGAGSASKGSPAASSTPPGSVPTFTLTGCATSQDVVAKMLTRLPLITGVREANLQGSASASGGAPASGSAACPAGSPSFTVQVIFAPLPQGSAGATSAPAGASDASNSTLKKAESTGGAQ